MSDQTTPRTYRDVLLPIVGADALHEAEARVYDREIGSTLLTPKCADGYCALGAILHAINDAAPPFPSASDFLELLPTPLDRFARSNAWDAAYDIITANDTGDLALPGALTALLDSEVAQ